MAPIKRARARLLATGDFMSTRYYYYYMSLGRGEREGWVRASFFFVCVMYVPLLFVCGSVYALLAALARGLRGAPVSSHHAHTHTQNKHTHVYRHTYLLMLKRPVSSFRGCSPRASRHGCLKEWRLTFTI